MFDFYDELAINDSLILVIQVIKPTTKAVKQIFYIVAKKYKIPKKNTLDLVKCFFFLLQGQ